MTTTRTDVIILSEGDRVRIRPLDSNHDWLVCEIALISHNGKSIALRTLDGGALRLRTGGLMANVIPIMLTHDRAYTALDGTELEVEVYREKVSTYDA